MNRCANAILEDAGSDRYPGGKGGAGVYHTIIRQIRPHRVFIAAFAGKCAVLRHKRQAAVSVVIDADAGVIDWWKRHLRRCSSNAIDDVVGRSVKLIHGDALRILASLPVWLDRETLIYLDPPYLRSVCTRSSRYRHSFETKEQHTSLLKLVKRLAHRGCMIMISGYPSKLYERKLRDWRCVTYPGRTRRGMKLECLWCNFPEPTVLHDSRYAGTNFRERTRLKRKAARWRKKFAAMPPLERQVISEALADLSVTCDAGRSPIGRSVNFGVAGQQRVFAGPSGIFDAARSSTKKSNGHTIRRAAMRVACGVEPRTVPECPEPALESRSAAAALHPARRFFRQRQGGRDA